MVHPSSVFLGLSAALLLAGGAVSAYAQSAPLTLPPPGYMEPGAAKAEGQAARQPSTKSRRAKADDAALAKPSTRRPSRKADPEFSDSAGSVASRDAKPRRFVPEEFDNGEAASEGGSARPIMTDTGHAGVGMRF